MLRNYLVTAWRTLLRNRTASIINLTGLSVSIAFCLLLFYHIRWEQSFDTFHANKDRIFRAEMAGLDNKMQAAKASNGLFASLLGDNDQKQQLSFPIMAGPDLQRNLPEVAAYCRLALQHRELIRAGGSVYKEEGIGVADDNFFRVFSFPLVKGDPRTVLSSPTNVVLTESVARKYFGNREPIGQMISIATDSGRLFRVSGVAKDVPANSSIQFGLVLPIKSDPDYEERVRVGFDNMMYQLVVELKPGADHIAFERKMNAWVKTYMKPFVDTVWMKDAPAAVRDRFGWHLRPFADCHYNVSSWGHYTDVKAIYQLLCVVAVILLLASLNYILITVSNAAGRSQEVGVRKVMGARRGSIILQSWIETQLIVGVAVGFGVLLSWISLPLLKSILGSGVSFGALSGTDVIVGTVVLAVGLGLLAGYYPALLISRLKPVSIMKSFSSVRVNPRFSKALVVIQFTCCVALMTAAFIIDRQMSFVIHKDLGFDKDQVLIIHNPFWGNGGATIRTRDQLYAFARSRPEVSGAASMDGGPTGSHNTNGITIGGKRDTYSMLMVDYHYFELLKLKFIAGRPFSPAFATDTAVATRPCVINEAMMRQLGPGAKLGVYNPDLRGTIIGVVKDYNFESLTQKIGPVQHRLSTTMAADFLFKIKAGPVGSTIAAFEAEWKKMTGNYPFSYDFLDASLVKRYEADQQWQKAMSAASFFAILIACMGLFGLSAIAVANRVKEIGIRKVLGASVRDLVAMLATGFVSMVVLAILIAMPLAWWMMNKWLEDFAYRIAIRWWMFGTVGVMAVGIALATVSYQVLRAARANPVEALRSE